MNTCVKNKNNYFFQPRIFFHEEITCFRKRVSIRIRDISLDIPSSLLDSACENLLVRLFEASKYCLKTEYKLFEKKISKANLSSIKLEFHNKYTELNEILKLCIMHWEDFFFTICKAWINDKKNIERLIFKGKIGDPISIEIEAGDKHCNGKSTTILMLSCGNKIVFKPRSLGIDIAFFEFANQLGFSEIFIPKFFTERQHGWMEFVKNKECNSVHEVERFYYQHGLILSLLYLLEASDMHHENWIAHGEYPVPIDLETLFQHMDDSIFSANTSNKQFSIGLHTICKSGMFFGDSPTIGKLSLETQSHLNGKNSFSAAILKGKVTSASNYLDSVKNGFSRGYLRILEHKSALLSLNSRKFKSFFNNKEVRYVCRHTKVYKILLDALSHPNYAKSKIKSNEVLKHLSNDLVTRPHLRELLNSEKYSLLKGDIPRFTGCTSKLSLSIDGETIFFKYFSQTPVELGIHKLAKMNQVDLDGQLKLLEWILGDETLVNFESINKSQQSFSQQSINQWVKSTGLLIAESIWKSSLSHQNVNLFPLFDFEPGIGLVFKPHCVSPYNGFTGTILYLAFSEDLGAKIDRDALVFTAKKLFTDAVTFCNWNSDNKGYHGISGLHYALCLLKTRWREQHWLVDSISQLLDISISSRDFLDNDILSGISGALLSLLACYQMHSDQRYEVIIKNLADELLERFSGSTEYWQTFMGEKLCGLAHGLSGVGLALIRTGKLFKNDNYLQVGLAVLYHEHQLYSYSIKNWPDFRSDNKSEQNSSSLSAWCHGAIGIGICRAEIIKLLGKDCPDFIHQDLNLVLDEFNYNSLQHNNSLCHGNFGNLELIIQSLMLKKVERFNSKYLELLAERTKNLLSDNKSFVGKIPDSASVMTGWSGIGWQLLRLNSIQNIPSIMTLSA